MCVSGAGGRVGVQEASVSVDKTGNGMSWHPPCWLGRGCVCESLYTHTHTQVGATRAGLCVCVRAHVCVYLMLLSLSQGSYGVPLRLYGLINESTVRV